MTKTMDKEHVSSGARKIRYCWWIHLLIFVSAQLAFFIVDNYSHWVIFNLNPLGEWVEANLSYLWDWIQLYEYQLFNLVTVVWGIALIIDGIISFFNAIFHSTRDDISKP
ncbi:hypothetical protein [Lentibacillus sp. Marseille-P4043]|uniref:hypothetical protein n=1 Tax=Lentibacillus sp. Marseille-P4043 TaxID=2040293 RepID=UPI000D0B0993|nr:hypothetical protein [Lentibacillus sp. Marseille-P4043]